MRLCSMWKATSYSWQESGARNRGAAIRRGDRSPGVRARRRGVFSLAWLARGQVRGRTGSGDLEQVPLCKTAAVKIRNASNHGRVHAHKACPGVGNTNTMTCIDVSSPRSANVKEPNAGG